MDDRLQQRTRYLLRARVRRVQTCPTALFEATAAQLVHWVRAHPVLGPIVKSLERDASPARAAVDDLVETARGAGASTRLTLHYAAKTSREHASLCWDVVAAIARLAGCDARAKQTAVLRIARFLGAPDPTVELNVAVDLLRDVAFNSVFEYLDEQLDGRNAVYGLLLKYKQRSERFWRERLRDVAANGLEGRRGERALAVDLCDYLLAQGVDITVEPSTGSGEPDVVLREPEGRTIVLDTKFVAEDAAPSRIKKTLGDGFHQVQRYCSDFSEPAGFLVVFIATAHRLLLPLPVEDGFPSLNIGGTTVYYLSVSISKEVSASKSGTASEVVVSLDDLKQLVVGDETPPKLS